MDADQRGRAAKPAECSGPDQHSSSDSNNCRRDRRSRQRHESARSNPLGTRGGQCIWRSYSVECQVGASRTNAHTLLRGCCPARCDMPDPLEGFKTSELSRIVRANVTPREYARRTYLEKSTTHGTPEFKNPPPFRPYRRPSPYHPRRPCRPFPAWTFQSLRGFPPLPPALPSRQIRDPFPRPLPSSFCA